MFFLAQNIDELPAGGNHFYVGVDPADAGRKGLGLGLADVIVFEVDLGKLDLLATQTVMQRLAVDPRGRDLDELSSLVEQGQLRPVVDSVNDDLAGAVCILV